MKKIKLTIKTPPVRKHHKDNVAPKIFKDKTKYTRKNKDKEVD